MDIKKFISGVSAVVFTLTAAVFPARNSVSTVLNAAVYAEETGQSLTYDGVDILSETEDTNEQTHKREPLDYNITDNEENKVNIAKSHAVELESVEYNTYDYVKTYNVHGQLDGLQEIADASGNIYAVFGKKDKFSVIPENQELNSFEIYNEGFEFGGAVIGVRKFTEEERKVADFNGDGKVDLRDAIAIAKYMLKK